MGYSIIFETKIIKLKDGRLLHLDRSGCNNDTAGRNKNEFDVTIYKPDEFLARIASFKADSSPAKGRLTDDGYPYWEMKIGSQYATMYDYGTHLERMLARAKTWDEMCKERYFYAISYDGVRVYRPIDADLTPEEFDKKSYEWMYNGGCSYRRLLTDYHKEDETIKAFDEGKIMSFYVGKAHKKTA